MPMERVNMTFKADPTLKTKIAQVVNVRTNKVYGSGIALKSDGSANYYVQLGQTDELKVVVTDTAPAGGVVTGSVLAESNPFTVTITK